MNAKFTLSGVLALSTLLFVGTGSASELEKGLGAVFIGAASGGCVGYLGHKLVNSKLSRESVVASLALGGTTIAYFASQRAETVKNLLGSKFVALSGFMALIGGTCTFLCLQERLEKLRAGRPNNRD